MRQWMTSLLISLMVLSSASNAAAQFADPSELDGLERAVGRWYMGPVTITTVSTTYNEAGTPISEERTVSTPVVTPDAAELRGTVMLAVAVMEFETDQHAHEALQAYRLDLEETLRRDPRTPEMRDADLAGAGDRAVAFTGEQSEEDVTAEWLFAAVQDGDFLYDITGQFVGLNGEEQGQSIARALVAAEAEPGNGEFREDGTSTGGLWSKLAQVDPVLAEGSTVADRMIHPPARDGAGGDTDLAGMPRVYLDAPESIADLDALHMQQYRLPLDEATPASSVSGVFVIDVWILGFDTSGAASGMMRPVLNTLSEDISVIHSFAGSEGMAQGDQVLESVGNEGYLEEPSLPPGSGVVQITRSGTTLYAAVVYAVDADSVPVAERVISQMLEAPGPGTPEVSGTDDLDTDGFQARFPTAGDPVLQGLVPVGDDHPDDLAALDGPGAWGQGVDEKRLQALEGIFITW